MQDVCITHCPLWLNIYSLQIGFCVRLHRFLRGTWCNGLVYATRRMWRLVWLKTSGSVFRSVVDHAGACSTIFAVSSSSQHALQICQRRTSPLVPVLGSTIGSSTIFKYSRSRLDGGTNNLSFNEYVDSWPPFTKF